MALHTVCHIEFDAVDMDRAQAFYEAVFGWTFREFMGGAMRVFGTGETHVGGLMKVESVKAGTSPSVWLHVEDCDATVAKALAAGGAVMKAKDEVPGVGWSAQFSDPEGNPVGIVQFA